MAFTSVLSASETQMRMLELLWCSDSTSVALSSCLSHELVFGLYAVSGERECYGILGGAKRRQLLREWQGKRSDCGRKICKKFYYFNIAVHKLTVLCVSFKAAELRAYLKSKGAEISEENSEGGLHVDLAQIIEVCDVCLKEDDKDVESVMNSVVSLLLILEPDKQEALIESLCEKLVKFREGERPSLRLQLLSNLFHGMDKNTPVRYTVYCSLLKVASSCGAIQYIPTELDQVRKWISDWNLSTDKKHTLLRLLYDVLVDCKKSDTAAKVMVELLGSYTEDNASQARVDAHRCIVRALKDPNTFLFDHLLALKPVKFLEGELIHDLLTIFVSAKLVSYVKFYQNNKDFIDSLGLLHEQNMAKMRLLTFMGMAVENKEISFDTMQQELQIGADDVEAFVIDAVKTKMVYCKIDQTQRKVVVSHSTHRTFGKQQWQQLYDTLNTWKQNLNQVKNSLLSLSDT
ncbi:eukaryotic translation initiation factor 3 subunit M [Meleagris gallopavo]|uniref:eukaryotic translation initiation factor 3 subunit M n=1 Tax=Meleagris gallopavo TaxID=9103 RepID=UPI00093C2E68|nr:eukaryotic translation initiation factor 3 subunit M [Meleagris gallopavo]